MVTRMERRAYPADHFSGLPVSLGESINVPHSTGPLSPVRHGGHARSASDSTQFSTTSFVSKLPPAVANLPKDDIRGYMHSKRVTNYLVGSTLGQGSFAKVKEAFHVLVGEKVAMKVIDKKKALQDSYVSKNLRREAKLLQMVRHPNILQLLEIVETDNSYYLITELCSGGELMKHIYDKTKLEEEEARKYMRQIVSAVDHLHRAGIIHRDLKVENLLLDSNMDLKIIDFGLSNEEFIEGEHGQVVHCSTQCGSPAYAAPELLGYKKYGPEVDIWSVGVNMYAMLTGCLPYTVEPFNITTLHAKMLENKMNPIPEYLSESCKDLLRRLLISNPEKRIKMPEIMAHPWMNEGHSLPFGPAPYPNPLTPSSINDDIMEHMVYALRLKDSEEELRQELLVNRATSASAVYHLLSARLARYQRQIQTKMTRVRRRSKRLSLDQGYYEGEDDDARSTISCPTRPRGTSYGTRAQRSSNAPVRHKKLGKIRPISDSALPVHIEEQEPSVPPTSRLHERRRTLPPTVLESDLLAFRQPREGDVDVSQKTSTLPRRKKSQERQQRDISPPPEPYEFDILHRPEIHLAPIRHPPTFPRNSYSQPKDLFQLRQNLHDQLHPPTSRTTPAWHSNPSSRNTSRQPSRAGSRNPSYVTSQDPSDSSIGHPLPPRHNPSSSELADLDNMDDIQFHHVNSYTTTVSPKHSAVKQPMFQLHSPEEDLSADIHFPTISQGSNRARKRSPEGEVHKAPHHRSNGLLHHPGEYRVKTDLGIDAIMSEIIRTASNLKMREFEEGARNTVICSWKGIRFSITVAKDAKNGTSRLNFHWLSGGDHKSYTDICKKMMDSIVIRS